MTTIWNVIFRDYVETKVDADFIEEAIARAKDKREDMRTKETAERKAKGLEPWSHDFYVVLASIIATTESK